MFEYELKPAGFSVGLFLMQQFTVPLFGFLLGGLSLVLFEGKSPLVNLLIAYFSFSAVGFGLGYKMQNAVPRVRSSGGPWIWIAPVCLLAWSFFNELRLWPQKVIPELFTGHGPETGYVMAFVTLPSVACCFYALGILAAHRRSQPAR